MPDEDTESVPATFPFPTGLAVVERLASIVIVLGAASAALGQSAPWQDQPHPAVVRIIAPDRSGASHGSGALVAADRTRGLVVTNWHVVREATGPIMVIFPDGFRSPATVLKTDRDWDLAALSIRRPNVRPIPLARAAPRRGEMLTIAGYGPGWYRAAAGRCTQYVSPRPDFPREMLELSTPARNGDSGGPIFNGRGELAGVLFGASFGQTTGTYCGRVRQFLQSVAGGFRESPPEGIMIAAGPQRNRPRADERVADERVAAGPKPIAAIDGGPSLSRPSDASYTFSGSRDPAAGSALPSDPLDAASAPVTAEPVASVLATGPTRAAQIKTILAAIGALALLFHGMRLCGAVLRS